MLGLNLSKQGGDDLVILAASAIFSHQNTGYNSKQSENPLLTKLADRFAKAATPGTE